MDNFSGAGQAWLYAMLAGACLMLFLLLSVVLRNISPKKATEKPKHGQKQKGFHADMRYFAHALRVIGLLFLLGSVFIVLDSAIAGAAFCFEALLLLLFSWLITKRSPYVLLPFLLSIGLIVAVAFINLPYYFPVLESFFIFLSLAMAIALLWGWRSGYFSQEKKKVDI